ncbi:MAG: DUF1957 domain-containing protein [Ignavibacteria bacterium]|jgi:1,4-alpha-glucan branching enzyme|nr:DUF1957 domain-containing protein [Ignavibacteria bacterium]
MHSGNLVLILHTHLPWVLHHGTWPHGEDWLTEAIAECYIPLLNVFNELVGDGIFPKITLDISPVLCEQLEHPDTKELFIKYCDKKAEAAAEDHTNFKNWNYDPHHIYMAKWWSDWYTARKNDFINKYNKSVIGGLRELQDKGAIEIMTCGATHGYFPLLGYDKSVNLQMKAAVENYHKHFGRKPRGTWLPECAYRSSYEWQSLIPVAPFNQKHLRRGVEQILADNEIFYFVTDEDLLMRSSPIGIFKDNNKEQFVHIKSTDFTPEPWNFDKSPLNLYEVSSSEKVEYGTAVAFTRHVGIAMQVWSGSIGYPAEADYLDFHKTHYPSRIRYWRVTDSKADMMYKTLYHPDWIWDKLDLQVNHFIHQIENTSNYYKNLTGKEGTVCLPFDTELFGHWWFEGPEFIRKLCQGLNSSPWVNMSTASDQLFLMKPRQTVHLPEGSWGENNNHDVWSNKGNNWTWQYIYDDELKLNNILENNPIEEFDSTERRILTQALRELMLLQSSDWQFLIYTNSAKDYAEQRFSFHHTDFNKLCDMFLKFRIDKNLPKESMNYLEATEKRNSVFPELQLEWWREKN